MKESIEERERAKDERLADEAEQEHFRPIPGTAVYRGANAPAMSDEEIEALFEAAQSPADHRGQ
ncbi:hypothetical protein KIM372_13600 [Bombiscardovia nodaiensis]|uniref:Uncharacterized protein n=1 Tax=Bombiscardovia nodaiensis TaxID=2932181 RepID=A0ABM8BA47_9BIFI|nr:hypothetical protein KIM372_13600 [Bombiscardovia nodaiensis]